MWRPVLCRRFASLIANLKFFVGLFWQMFGILTAHSLCSFKAFCRRTERELENINKPAF